jgi:hypothetical protein
VELLALEDKIPYWMVESVCADYNKTPVELMQMSVYQIMLLFLAKRRADVRMRYLVEEIKAWLNPDAYMRIIEVERNKRVNVLYMKEASRK